MRNLNKRGVSIIAAMAIMLIIAVLTLSMVSMLGVTSRQGLDSLRSAQALGLAQAGLNWYMTQLAGTNDWDTTTNQTGITLGPGTFDVTLSNKAGPQTDSTTVTRMDISVTGKVTGTDGVTLQRAMAQRVWKLPSASKFALFWGRRTGSTLTLNSSTISGDFWSQGSSTFSGSTISNGKAFRPSTESITGASSTAITFPYFSGFSGATSTFSTPALATTYYTNLISTYNGMIAGSGTINQNSNLVLTGNTITCQNFNTNTTVAGANVTISGNGFIIASRDINLNTTGTNGRTLTISPSRGLIVFLAGRSLTINTGSGGTHPVAVSSGVRFYSASNSANTQLLTVNNANTSIDGTLFLANRRIVVQNSANITGSTLFVDYPGSATNNFLRVTGSGTSVGTAVSPCNLISIGRANANLASALTVDTGASVTGLLYQYDGANTGETDIATATITGILIANQFNGNAVSSLTLTYDPSVILDLPPEGFNGFATKDPNTWTGS